MYIYVEKIFEL